MNLPFGMEPIESHQQALHNIGDDFLRNLLHVVVDEVGQGASIHIFHKHEE